MTLLAGGICQFVGLASGEVRRTVGKVQFSDTLARRGTDEPPSPASRMKLGGSHRYGEVYRLSIQGISQPQIASLRRPGLHLILDGSDDLVAATPMNQSGVALRALPNALDRQD